MSSSIIVEPQEGSSKKENTLILMVNDNGVISVDQDTLNGLIGKYGLTLIIFIVLNSSKLGISENLFYTIISLKMINLKFNVF